VRIVVLGATSAIAQAAARIWAERGEDLLLVGRDPQKLEAVAADLRTRGGAVETVVHDLDRDHAALVGRLGAPDVVLLAQGVFGDASRRDRDPEYAESILRTNLISPVRLLTLLAPSLPRGSCIAALSSVAGDRGRARVGV
jgi:decaprenylphospho-beta-D-erythro-pentofuranosid-2-ulose 2-reductase